MYLFDPVPQPQAAPAVALGGPVVRCDRCGVLLRFRPRPGNIDARIMRVAQQPKGVCATCGFRIWLATDFGGALEQVIERDLKGNPAAFQLPHVQAVVKRAMEVGKCDAPFEEVSFDKLTAEWDLPVPGAKGRRR